MVERRNKLTIKDFKDTKTREVLVVPWPGSDKEVGMLLLNAGEMQESHLAARAHFRKKGQDLDIFSNDSFIAEENYQIVLRSLCDPESKTGDPRVFQDIAGVRKFVNDNEIEYFIQHHAVGMTNRRSDWKFPEFPATDES